MGHSERTGEASDHRARLAEVVEAARKHRAVDYLGLCELATDLARWLADHRHLARRDSRSGRELKALGFAKIPARPAPSRQSVAVAEKGGLPRMAKIHGEDAGERLSGKIEHVVDTQGLLLHGHRHTPPRRGRAAVSRCWRPVRSEWAYISGDLSRGEGAGLVMPWCDTDAMAAHLIEISAAVDPGAHAVLIVDQAGWHLTPKLLRDPRQHHRPGAAATIARVEPAWRINQFMRADWLSNRIWENPHEHRALCLPSLATSSTHAPNAQIHGFIIPLVLEHGFPGWNRFDRDPASRG